MSHKMTTRSFNGLARTRVQWTWPPPSAWQPPTAPISPTSDTSPSMLRLAHTNALRPLLSPPVFATDSTHYPCHCLWPTSCFHTLPLDCLHATTTTTTPLVPGHLIFLLVFLIFSCHREGLFGLIDYDRKKKKIKIKILSLSLTYIWFERKENLQNTISLSIIFLHFL